MSKIDSAEVDVTATGQTHSAGCGCGHKAHASEQADHTPAANPEPSSERAAHDHAAHINRGSCCCGGSKTQK
jgi:hypothetical protein